MKRILFLLCLSALLIRASVGARGLSRADDESTWEESSLVYVVVVSVTNTTPGNVAKMTVKVRPVATLTGRFDCGLFSEIDLSLVVDGFGANPTAPAAGDKDVMLIDMRLVEEKDGTMRRIYFISASLALFMPSNCPILKVSGIDDPAIAALMDRVRRARSHEGQ